MQLTAAVAQTATVMFDTAATVARAESLMHEAAQRGARRAASNKTGLPPE